ncbi:MAG: 3-deoxy-manno-octulosonate cytidylyltransferase [Holosporaceae bacterium]|jgi:3-deoxy-manno-octulosonate cytidylyltransferase (CMP-KDO synthetase)|nr:3-deoxy-manno-octulosonate cytidylyltransferase [Holosporaceae bacterium]
MDTLVVIPARLSSVRLTKKMFADIGGKPLIRRTYESVVASDVGEVIVACDGEEIASVIRDAGGRAVITDPSLPSGTDRVFAAWSAYDTNAKFKFIVNVQGDLPFIDKEFIITGVESIKEKRYDITTLASAIKNDSYLQESVVKPVIAFTSENSGKALYFSRSPIPFNGPYFCHVGIYCFQAESLRKFVNLPQSPLEKGEKLEQLRALENNMTIGIDTIDRDPPITIDTASDLEQARKYFESLK